MEKRIGIVNERFSIYINVGPAECTIMAHNAHVWLLMYRYHLRICNPRPLQSPYTF